MIGRTFYSLFFSIAFSDIIIYVTHIHAAGQTWAKGLWFVPSLLLIAGLVLVMYGRKQFYMIDKAHVASFYFMFCLSITIPKCVFAVTYLTRYIFQQFTTTDLHTLFTDIALVLAAAFFVAITYGTWWGWRWATVNNVSIKCGRLPREFDGFRLVHISDIHASTWSANPRDFFKIVAKINAQKPDAIMFTGDLITHKTSELEPPFSKYGNLPAAMQGVDGDSFKILLSHNPSHWEAEVMYTDIDLTLSGHTHAMQLKVFGLSPAKLKYKYWNGLHKEKGKYLYVNEGLGCTLIPFRFGTWPEITVITLRSKR